MPCRFSLGMACRPAVRIMCGINLTQMKIANNQRLPSGKSSLPENENSMRNIFNVKSCRQGVYFAATWLHD